MAGSRRHWPENQIDLEDGMKQRAAALLAGCILEDVYKRQRYPVTGRVVFGQHMGNVFFGNYFHFSFSFCFFVRDGHMAVSYTHLDVYKRQVYIVVSSRIDFNPPVCIGKSLLKIHDFSSIVQQYLVQVGHFTQVFRMIRLEFQRLF